VRVVLARKGQFLTEGGHSVGAYETYGTYRDRRRCGAIERVVRDEAETDDVALLLRRHLERCFTEVIAYVDSGAMLGYDALGNARLEVTLTETAKDDVFEFVVLEDAVTLGRDTNDDVLVLTDVAPSVGGNAVLGEEGHRLHAEAVGVLVTNDFVAVDSAVVDTGPIEGTCFCVDVTHVCVVCG